jgi:transcriptional pleiotropic regulator of transition state genes
MKATGIVRKLDELGRITLPIELRRTLNVEDRDPLEIFVDEDTVVLKKYVPEVKVPMCAICKTAKNLIKVDGAHVCIGCAAAVTAASVKVLEG